jgi:DUF4097 and DUF4098 domain-containing protein YvlB
MKTNLYLKAGLLTSMILGLAGNMVALSAKEIREELRQTHPLTSTGRFSLENVNGQVHITAWERDEVKIEAVKRGEKQEHLDQVKIEIDAQADRIRIKTKFPESKLFRSKRNSTSVDYAVTVPRGALLDSVSTVNGDLIIEGVRGRIKGSTVNGKIDAKDLTGSSELSSVNGAVKAGFVKLGEDASVSLKTVNGGLTLGLPGKSNAALHAATVNGGISSDFPLTIKKYFPLGQNLNGKIGEGNASIKLNSVNGGIAIVRN